MCSVQTQVWFLAIVTHGQGTGCRQVTDVSAQDDIRLFHLITPAAAGVQIVLRVQGSGSSSLREDHDNTWRECQSPSQVSHRLWQGHRLSGKLGAKKRNQGSYPSKGLGAVDERFQKGHNWLELWMSMAPPSSPQQWFIHPTFIAYLLRVNAGDTTRMK